MAKKTKKQTRKVSGGGSQSFERKAAPAPEATGPIPATRVSSADFNPDYSQTIKDLKRIGTLAGSFFIVLVIISFFLR